MFFYRQTLPGNCYITVWCSWLSSLWSICLKIGAAYTAQKTKFSIKDFFSKCDKIRSFLRIWSHLLEKSIIGKLHFLCSDKCILMLRWHVWFLWLCLFSFVCFFWFVPAARIKLKSNIRASTWKPHLHRTLLLNGNFFSSSYAVRSTDVSLYLLN